MNIIDAFQLTNPEAAINYSKLMAVANTPVLVQKITYDSKSYMLFFKSDSPDVKHTYLGYLPQETLDPSTGNAYWDALEHDTLYHVSNISAVKVDPDAADNIYQYKITLIDNTQAEVAYFFANLGDLGNAIYDMMINDVYALKAFAMNNAYFIFVNGYLFENKSHTNTTWQKKLIECLESIQYNINVDYTVGNYPVV